MRICPACGNQYPNDANFCPMDATRLLEPEQQKPAVVATPARISAPLSAVAAPVRPATMSAGMATASTATADSTLRDENAPIAGRFVQGEPRIITPLGPQFPAIDAQGGAAVLVQIIESRALPTTAMADRVLRELKQLGKVKTDKVLRVIDQGKLPGNRLYIVSEAPTGPTLEEIVTRSGPLSVDRARAVVLALGEALVEAQKAGVIHRDLAPRNVFVGERVQLTGFGVAEPISDKVFGAPAFLSPEQAEGKPVDQRSNIYSLGALLHYMVTGLAPFAGDAAEQVQQHLHAQPVPPSEKRRGLGADLDRVVAKALEKSGGRRHLTLRQLLNEVEALVVVAIETTDGYIEGDSTVTMAAAPSVAVPAPASTLVDLVAPGVASPQVMDAAPVNALSATGSVAAPVIAVVPMETAATGGVAVAARQVPDVTVAPESQASVAAKTPESEAHSAAEHTAAPGGVETKPSAAEMSALESAATIFEMKAPTMDPVEVVVPLVHKAVEPSAAMTVIGIPAPTSLVPAPDVTPLPAPAPPAHEPPSTTASGPIALDKPVAHVERPAVAPVPNASSFPAPARQGSPASMARTMISPIQKTPAKVAKRGFRETGWFKKGELEQEMAKRAAELSSEDPLAGPALTEVVVDDSSITNEDRARLSLKTGRTEMMPAVKTAPVPGDRMSDEELIAEMDGSRKWLVVSGVGVFATAVAAAIWYFFLHG